MIQYQDSVVATLNNKIANLKQELSNKDDFMTYVHHEINGYIHNIHFFADHLAEFWNKTSTEGIQKHIGIIVESAEYLKLVSEDLFNLSRFNSGEMKFDFKQVNLLDVIKESVDRCTKIFLTDKNLKIVFQGNKITKASVSADNKRIRQLLINLITNSIKYSKKGIITVRLEESEEEKHKCWKVSVIDQGPGIPENDLESVFEPFFKVQSTISSIPSFGLGLSLCKKIVEAHGGTIKATNNSDAGVTFSFCIPVFD